MKIVVIDDVKTNLIIIESMLKKFQNCETYLFEDPKEALKWCENNNPDLIITDYMMPELNGVDVAKKFRALKKNEHVPIVMVTAYNEDSIKIEALKEGVTDFLIKPINKAEFQARINNLLKLREYYLKVSDKAKWLEEEVKKATAEIEKREEEIIYRLSIAAEFRDDDTGEHIKRMAHYCYIIAKELNLDKTFTEMILKASPMHDVGKISIPDNILLKPARLTPEEFEIIKTHTINGYNILSNSDIPLIQLSAEIALNHHEKFNGKGYPNGLQGKDIPISGRITAVADVFDALTSKRPYKEPWPVEKAIELLKKEKGEHFDPDCVDAFLNRIDDALKIMNKYK